MADWLAALSLANLVFLRCWAELLSPDESRIYWLMSVPAPIHYVSLMLDVLLLGSLLLRVDGRDSQEEPDRQPHHGGLPGC